MRLPPRHGALTSLIVAGAGLGGLTAGLALARRGYAVTLVERSPVLSEAGAGVQLSPNATRVLRALGLLDTIAADAVRPEAVLIRRFRDGAQIAQVPLGTAAERRYGAPFLLAHRADVQAALLTAARAQPGLAIMLGERLTGFAVAGSTVDASLASGSHERRLVADGLVGADGLRSVVRAVLMGGTDAPRFSGRLAWRSLVPAGRAPSEVRAAASQLWLGPHAHLVHYPVRGGALINVVVIVDGAEAREAGVEDWARPGDPVRLAARLKDWAPLARRLIEAAPDWRVWPLFDRPALPRWSQGPVTLLGDAAHPMLPFLAQGAAQAIADACVLALAATPDRPFAAAAADYAAARKASAERVQRESARQGTIYHFDGPLALARDGVMRLLGPGRMQARYDWLYGAPERPAR